MRILGIDPARNTGLALWDTGMDGPPATRAAQIRDDLDRCRTLGILREFCGAEAPDYIIMERPFLGEPMIRNGKILKKQNIKGYDTHISVLHHWMHCLYDYCGAVLRSPESKGHYTQSHARLVWPSTWQAVIFEGIMVSGDSKVKSRHAAARKWSDIRSDLSSDEYDACNLCLFQWLLCRDLGTDPKHKSITDALRAGGWILPTATERSLLK